MVVTEADDWWLRTDDGRRNTDDGQVWKKHKGNDLAQLKYKIINNLATGALISNALLNTNHFIYFHTLLSLDYLASDSMFIFRYITVEHEPVF